MPKWNTLSGREVLRTLREFGFVEFSRRGSHVKVRRILANGHIQTLTVPDHREIDRGTLHAIFRQACRFIPESELRARFLTD